MLEFYTIFFNNYGTYYKIVKIFLNVVLWHSHDIKIRKLFLSILSEMVCVACVMYELFCSNVFDC